MLVTVYEAYWVRDGSVTINIDPTRMAQGIMTGIGFLGAGAILKDGYTVRGLTTAASVWMTAAIGNAVYHATGRRVRDLPITPDKIIGEGGVR